MKKTFCHDSTFEEQLTDTSGKGLCTTPRRKRRNDQETHETSILPQKLCERIYHEAKDQVEEVDQEQSHQQQDSTTPLPSAFLTRSLKTALAQLESEDEPICEEMGAFQQQPNQGMRFSDVVFEKVEKLKQHKKGRDGGAPAIEGKILKLYEGVGDVFSRYTNGKIPQAFRFVPNLSNWEEVLYLTRPDAWTPHAHLVATKVFMNNNPKIAQKFMNRILLPHLRQEIESKRKLHLALYETLKHCCQKAGAFYKGIIIPLCKSGTCDVREAVIFSSVIKRQSLPIHHSAAALLCLAEMEYSGPTSFFLKTLIEKNYALPFKALDGLVEHFMRFEHEQRTLPAIWHQCFLAFVQNYRKRVKREDLDDLRRLARKQHHSSISIEIYKGIDAILHDSDDMVIKEERDKSVRMDLDH